MKFAAHGPGLRDLAAQRVSRKGWPKEWRGRHCTGHALFKGGGEISFISGRVDPELVVACGI